MSFDIFNWLAEKAVGGKGDEIFGTKPETIGYTPVDLGVEAGKASRSNLGNMGDINALLERIMPGWGKMLQQSSTNNQALLRGEIPKDVQDQVRRSSAFKSLMGGFGGSGMSKALTARDFGTTSMNLMEAGNNAAQRWAGMAQGAVAPFMVTAAQQGEQAQRNTLYDQITRQHAANVRAAPDPTAAGIFNLQTALGSMAASWGTSQAMGGMGGGGGQQQQQAAPSYASNPYQGVNWQNPWGG